MTGNTIPPPDLDLLARRAKVERETADSAEAQTLMDPIFPAMLACSGYLDSLGLMWGRSMSCWRIIWSPPGNAWPFSYEAPCGPWVAGLLSGRFAARAASPGFQDEEKAT